LQLAASPSRESAGKQLVKNILIVDNDFGFVFWLGQALDAAGYEALPAKGVSEAVALLAELRVVIDVIILRCNLPGADELVEKLRSTQRGRLKAIALIEQTIERRELLSAWDGWQLKPHLTDNTGRGNFLKLVQAVLEPRAAVPIT